MAQFGSTPCLQCSSDSFPYCATCPMVGKIVHVYTMVGKIVCALAVYTMVGKIMRALAVYTMVGKIVHALAVYTLWWRHGMIWEHTLSAVLI